MGVKIFKIVFLLLVICGAVLASVSGDRAANNSAFGERGLINIASNDGVKTACIQPIIYVPSETNGVLRGYVLVSLDGVEGAIFSRQCDAYALVDGRIVGLSMEGGHLKLVFSNIKSASDWVDPLLNHIGLNPNRLLDEGDRNHTNRIDLGRIFGRGEIVLGSNPPTGAQGEAFIIKKVTVIDNLIHISWSTTSMRSIELVLNSTFQVLAASESGQPVRMLSRGVVGFCDNWGAPKKKPFIGKNGDKCFVLGRERSYDHVNAAGEQGVGFIFSAWKEDGIVWVGPSTCQLVEFGNEIVGFETDQKDCHLLHIYRSDSKIDLVRDGVRKFEEKLNDTDELIEKSDAAGLPKLTIDLRHVFKDLDSLMKIDLRVKSIKYNGHQLNVSMRTMDPNTVLELAVGPTLLDLHGYVSKIAE